MILSYKKQFPWGEPTNFEEKILNGSKIHTFREDKNRRWKAGRKAHHANGVRTKNYNCFKEGPCDGIQEIGIYYTLNESSGSHDRVLIYIDGKMRYDLTSPSNERSMFVWTLAKNDGFDSIKDFFKWFKTDFAGVIIHFTDFRY